MKFEKSVLHTREKEGEEGGEREKGCGYRLMNESVSKSELFV